MAFLSFSLSIYTNICPVELLNAALLAHRWCLTLQVVRSEVLGVSGDVSMYLTF